MDTYLERLVMANPNLLVPWYLMASYLYYCEDESLISDAAYDCLCRALHDKWGEVEHMHKHLVDYDSLAAGTGYTIPTGIYPERVKGAAHKLLRALRELTV